MQEAKTQDRKAQQDKCLLRATKFLARLAVVMCSARCIGHDFTAALGTKISLFTVLLLIIKLMTLNK